jgi:hypothetical protein
LNGKQKIIFIQSLAPNDKTNKKDTRTINEIETVITWSTANYNFELKGIHVNMSDLNMFKQSLHLLPVTTDSIIIPFKIIECSELSEKNSSKFRTFTLFTPAELINYSKNQRMVIDKKWKASKNTIIIGMC